jgi:hypothetical protein
VAKLITVIIVGLGAAFYFPDSRALLLDRFSFAADPLMEWITVQEMRRVRGDLARWDDRRRAFPTNRDLPTWMRTHYQNDDTQYDAWGNPYWLVSGRDQGHRGRPVPECRPGRAAPVTSPLPWNPLSRSSQIS